MIRFTPAAVAVVLCSFAFHGDAAAQSRSVAVVDPAVAVAREAMPVAGEVSSPAAAVDGVAAPTATDSAAIRTAALDYIQGWYQGDAERMRRSLHPELTKRILRREQGRSRLDGMSAEQLIQMTAGGGGRNTPAARRRTDVRILDIFGAAASVRVDAHDWIDYMHLSRTAEGWRIVNVLWELR